MRRPREHRIGEAGEFHVAHTFVQYGWIVEKLQSDYGFDFLLQRVDGESVTGDFALLQVKATQASIAGGKNGAPRIRISGQHLRLWESTPIPLYLVVVNLASEGMFILNCRDWVSTLRQANGDCELNKKSYSVNPNQLMPLSVETATRFATEVTDYWKDFRQAAMIKSIAQVTIGWIPGIGTLVRTDPSLIKLNSQLAGLIGASLASRVTGNIGRDVQYLLDSRHRKRAPNPL